MDMDPQEREEIISALREELQEFFTWIMEEFDYYKEQGAGTGGVPLEKPLQDKIKQRIASQRMNLWERDLYAFFDDPDHPSIYSLFEAADLEIIHYLEELNCDHFKVLDVFNGDAEDIPESYMRYEDTFGVLLSSQAKGWMYRLDFCQICGLVEVWSMTYNPAEIALYSSDPEEM